MQKQLAFSTSSVKNWSLAVVAWVGEGLLGTGSGLEGKVDTGQGSRITLKVT